MTKTVTDVLRALRVEPGEETERHGELLHDGRGLHLDFGEGDQVFLVGVQRIIRRWLTLPPETTLGPVDGKMIAVRSVALANHVEVTLDAADDTAEGVGAADAGAALWPGDRVMREIRVSVSDDLSTVYRMVSAEAGGEEHPWRALTRFLPTPPPDATALDLTFSVGETSPVRMIMRISPEPH